MVTIHISENKTCTYSKHTLIREAIKKNLIILGGLEVLGQFFCFRMLHNISTIGPPTNTTFLHPLNIGDGRGVIRVLDNVKIS